jgi:hypothetical protein
VGYYFNCLVPLAFEIGLRATRHTERRRIYHHDRGIGYVTAHDGWE